jgi:UDP-4-amino-4,6-dideoxy-N-acetyl-beta-L-altrosamine N-acetyltransferase
MTRCVGAKAKYSFKNFIEMIEQESDEVLKGRNEADVRRWMVTDRLITPDEHRSFILSLKASSTQVYLKVERNGYFAGVYSLIDIHEGSAVGGFWVTAYARRRLLSLSVVFQSIRYVFDTFPIETIRGYQLIENNSVAKLNRMLGFRPVATPANADPRMSYLTLTRDTWSSQVLSDQRLLKLVELAECRNED